MEDSIGALCRFPNAPGVDHGSARGYPSSIQLHAQLGRAIGSLMDAKSLARFEGVQEI